MAPAPQLRKVDLLRIRIEGGRNEIRSATFQVDAVDDEVPGIRVSLITEVMIRVARNPPHQEGFV